MTLQALTAGLQGVRPLSGRAAREPLADDDRICIFVNGILNNVLSAHRSAMQLQRARQIPDRTMLFFHISDARAASGPSDFLNTVNEADQLERALAHLATCGRDLEVHAHSRGALAVERALTALERNDANWQQMQACLHLHTYGGVRILSPSLGTTVENFINTEDMIVFGGRSLFGITARRGTSEHLTHNLAQWVMMLQPTDTEDEITDSLKRYCQTMSVPVEKMCDLASTLRVRTWHGSGLHDAHSFESYLQHLTPTTSEAAFEGRIHSVAMRGQFANLIVGFMMLFALTSASQKIDEGIEAEHAEGGGRRSRSGRTGRGDRSRQSGQGSHPHRKGHLGR